MPKEPIRAPRGVNVPGLTMAGFQLTLHGRIWVIPEGGSLKRIVLPIEAGSKEQKAARDCTTQHKHLDTTEL